MHPLLYNLKPIPIGHKPEIEVVELLRRPVHREVCTGKVAPILKLAHRIVNFDEAQGEALARFIIDQKKATGLIDPRLDVLKPWPP